MIPVLYPMMADKVSVEKLPLFWESKKYIAERKYDGARYLIRKENGKISIVSRQKSKKTGLPVDKTDRVPHLVELFQSLPDGTVIDGEMITDVLGTSNQVTSIMGSLPERAIKLQQERGELKYVMYDVLFFNGHKLTHVPYEDRRKVLETIFSQFFSFHTPFVLLSEVFYDEKEKAYNEIVEEGGEGVILKAKDSVYEPGERPKGAWIKVKRYETFDCVIMGFTEPTMEYEGKSPETWSFWFHPKKDELYYRMNEPEEILREKGYIPVSKSFYYGWCGAVRFGQYKDGELVEIGQTSGLSDEWKQKFADNPDYYIGKVIEVGSMKQIKKTGALQHPRFLGVREDKTAEECILGVN